MVIKIHELGVVFELVNTVERIVEEQRLTEVEAIVLQVGELSSMIPKYIEQCFPAAVDGTKFENTALKIEVIPGNAICCSCKKVFNIRQSNGQCPVCSKRTWELLSGKEFLIKEIIAY